MQAFELDDPEQAATLGAADSAAEAEAIRTPAERFADVAEQATAGRATTLLDRLADRGALTSPQREAIVADAKLATLARTLRQAEVAGHDPEQVLTEAVAGRSLSGSYSPAGVLQFRITSRTELEPAGDSYAEWVPAVDDPAWARHLGDLAAAADRRRDDLGADAGEQPPAWAVEALGPVPQDPAEREEWERRAGDVAAHRELMGCADDSVALPGPPKRGQVEAYASWRSAWRALGRPDAQREETELSDGQLRMRVRAYAREKNWEPAYVAHELSGISQAEDRQGQLASVRAAEAEAAIEEPERERLESEAAEAAALADALAAQKDQLDEADEIRARWYAHTASTRAAAQRAEAELAGRGADVVQAEDARTSRDWIVAHAEDQQAADADREITDETDLTDVAGERETDLASIRRPAAKDEIVVPNDVRADPAEAGAHEQEEPAEDWNRVPEGDETADAVARARSALAELERRQAAEREATIAEHASPERAAVEATEADLTLE